MMGATQPSPCMDCGELADGTRFCTMNCGPRKQPRMPPQQRALILHALGLEPRGGRMRRWSRKNNYCVASCYAYEWERLLSAGWAERVPSAPLGSGWAFFRVTRAGAEAAGVLGRCRREDLGL